MIVFFATPVIRDVARIEAFHAAQFSI
jgi:hypothetical protein